MEGDRWMRSRRRVPHLVLAHRHSATRLVDHRQKLFVIQFDGVRARPQQGARARIIA